jgi:hypothetical protein
MRLTSRIRKLAEQAKALGRRSFRVGRRRECVGASWERVWELFLQAVPEESHGVMEEIIGHCEDYAKNGEPSRLPGGVTQPPRHGFLDWIVGLQEGWADLPETIPHVVLVAWRNDYVRRQKRAAEIFPWVGNGHGASAAICWRCVHCHMVLPNAAPTEGGYGACIFPCPVCGGREMQHMNFAKWGEFGNIEPAGFFRRGPQSAE